MAGGQSTGSATASPQTSTNAGKGPGQPMSDQMSQIAANYKPTNVGGSPGQPQVQTNVGPVGTTGIDPDLYRPLNLQTPGPVGQQFGGGFGDMPAYRPPMNGGQQFGGFGPYGQPQLGGFDGPEMSKGQIPAWAVPQVGGMFGGPYGQQGPGGMALSPLGLYGQQGPTGMIPKLPTTGGAAPMPQVLPAAPQPNATPSAPGQQTLGATRRPDLDNDHNRFMNQQNMGREGMGQRGDMGRGRDDDNDRNRRMGPQGMGQRGDMQQIRPGVTNTGLASLTNKPNPYA